MCFACTLLPGCVRSVHRITSDLSILSLLARTVTQHNNFYMATFSRPFGVAYATTCARSIPLQDFISLSARRVGTFEQSPLHISSSAGGGSGEGSSLALS